MKPVTFIFVTFLLHFVINYVNANMFLNQGFAFVIKALQALETYICRVVWFAFQIARAYSN